MGTILIIDDEPELRFLLRQVLEHEGYECLEAGDGNMALQMLKGYPSISLMVTDFNMPGMDGLQLLARKAADPLLWNIPTIFMTAEHSLDLCMKAIQAGAIQVLFKPYDIFDLKSCIRRVLEPLQATSVVI